MLAVRKVLTRAGVLPVLVAVVFGALVRPGSADVVKPSVAPVSWELKFSFADPQRITLTLPGDRQKTTFWYMVYTVENDTGREVPFFPTAELVTQSLEVVQGGEQISPSVYKAIMQRHKETHPFLIEPEDVLPAGRRSDDSRASESSMRVAIGPFRLAVRQLSNLIRLSEEHGNLLRCRLPDVPIQSPRLIFDRRACGPHADQQDQSSDHPPKHLTRRPHVVPFRGMNLSSLCDSILESPLSPQHSVLSPHLVVAAFP